MNGIEIDKYINKKCYDCCHFKKENMELYKLNLPNGTVNNIIGYALDEEHVCRTCTNSRCNRELIRCHLNLKRINNRNVEDEILIFLIVYDTHLMIALEHFLKSIRKV